MQIEKLTSPQQVERFRLFLAGGITNCPDWQAEITALIASQHSHLTIMNPRAENFDMTNPVVTLRQIQWEYHMLGRADAVLFWFCKETIQPIALFELGGQLRIGGRKIFIGVHPEYPRAVDVSIQTKLIRPDIRIVSSLDELAHQVVGWESDMENLV